VDWFSLGNLEKSFWLFVSGYPEKLVKTGWSFCPAIELCDVLLFSDFLEVAEFLFPLTSVGQVAATVLPAALEP
jgi:hypothetical protein